MKCWHVSFEGWYFLKIIWICEYWRHLYVILRTYWVMCYVRKFLNTLYYFKVLQSISSSIKGLHHLGGRKNGFKNTFFYAAIKYIYIIIFILRKYIVVLWTIRKKRMKKFEKCRRYEPSSRTLFWKFFLIQKFWVFKIYKKLTPRPIKKILFYILDNIMKNMFKLPSIFDSWTVHWCCDVLRLLLISSFQLPGLFSQMLATYTLLRSLQITLTPETILILKWLNA